MTTLDPSESSRRAVREALAALNRGDEAGAAIIARAHAAQDVPRRGRVTLLLPLRAPRVSAADEGSDTRAS